MDEPQVAAPGSDDTAAFQRFYGTGPASEATSRGVLYRIFVAWWRDRG